MQLLLHHGVELLNELVLLSLQVPFLVLRNFIVENLGENMDLLIERQQLIEEICLIFLHFGLIYRIPHILWKRPVLLCFPLVMQTFAFSIPLLTVRFVIRFLIYDSVFFFVGSAKLRGHIIVDIFQFQQMQLLFGFQLLYGFLWQQRIFVE